VSGQVLVRAAWSRIVSKTGLRSGFASDFQFLQFHHSSPVLFTDGTADCSDDLKPYQTVGLEDIGHIPQQVSSPASKQ